MRQVIFIFLFLCSSSLLIAQSTVSTFHAISLYWSPAGGEPNKKVLVQYSVAGANEWKPGFSMKYLPIAGCGNNPETGERYDKADYRGSIVDLTPGTTYDIQMTLEGTATTTTIQATTWSETFPIGQTINVGSMNTRYDVPSSGSANGYLLIDGTGSTIDIQDGLPQCIRLIDKSYVIIRGFTLKNAGSNGIRLFNCHHIVIEDCDISGWGEEDIDGTGFGKAYQAGIYAGSDDAKHVVIQRNKIHHPRWDTNSWAELHDPNDANSYHPSGPQGIALGQCNIGNNVIRYNEIWSDDDHYFNDILGMWSNASYDGFPGPDSDIYGNYLANCWDDGIESEGSNMNVRIFANYIEENLIPIANAATSIGPLYIWKNVTGRSNSPVGSLHGEYGPFLKLGYASDGVQWMTGQTYVFNNTTLQPNGEGAGGMGTVNGGNRHIKHCMSRNNIFHVKDVTTNSISDRATNEDIDFDYDLMNKGFPAGHETNGISNAIPVYAAPAPTIDFVTKTGDFRLASNSPGYDAGEIIPNFTDTYNGAGPDMGAHEAGTDPMVFGITSVYPLPLHPLPIDLMIFKGEKQSDIHRLTWVTESEINASHFDIEYSEGGTSWTSIGSVRAKNNVLEQQFYAFRYRPSSKKNFYRLRMVDLDGHFRYSDIIFLDGFTENVTISPNPSNDQISLSNIQGKVDVQIYDNSGLLVLNQLYNGHFVDVEHLPKGTYYLRVNGGELIGFVLE